MKYMKKSIYLSVISTILATSIVVLPMCAKEYGDAQIISLNHFSFKPAYTVAGRDTTVQIFLYSPGEHSGLHLAYLGDDQHWHEVSKLLDCDYGQWGVEKRMYHPFVAQASDGTWRALWGLNDYSPAFAVAYSEDLLTWRPQDYPILREKGVSDPVAYQMADGTWDVYVKTRQGQRYLNADKDFRHFKEDSVESTAENILWQMDTATIAGKHYDGNLFEVPLLHLQYLYHELMERHAQDLADAKGLPITIKDSQGKAINSPVSASLIIDYNKTKSISDKLFGIFFEDISYAADGGLGAELLQNGDFEYNKDDQQGKWNSNTAWIPVLKIDTVRPLSKNNPHYTVLADSAIYNEGWDSIPLKRGAVYDFSFYARNIDCKKKTVKVALINKDQQTIGENKLVIHGDGWNRYSSNLKLEDKGHKNVSLEDAHLAILPEKKGHVAIDMISLVPQDTYKGHGMRKDIADTIAALHPQFVRFPGGCMVHGDGLDNIYNWKESIGPLQDRKPAKNIWRYHQSRHIGYYEYFQWCEDMGAQPLPVLSAGVPCQNSAVNAEGLGGQQGGIPMDKMPVYVQDVLDLIEWANGDPAVSKWAKMRAEAGHPAPFNLKMIGIGNEDLVSTVFEERYLMIAKAVKAKYPNIEIVGTVGPFHYPSSDYIEGWKLAKESRVKNSDGKMVNLFGAVDEHYYEQPSWFLNHQNYYDDYDRTAPKVYLGEYASRSRNIQDNALAEALYLTNVERNGDIVEMSSFAPLLSKNGHSNWSTDLIYFDNTSVKTTPDYEVQKMFATHNGSVYIESNFDIDEALRKFVGISVVRNSHTGKTWLKIVNILPQPLNIHIDKRTVTVNARDYKIVEL